MLEYIREPALGSEVAVAAVHLASTVQGRLSLLCWSEP